MELTNLSVIRELMSRYGTVFKKSLGQNFLTSANVPVRIADAAAESGCDSVVEIGPGIGTLTQRLCERFERVVAVEVDSSLLPILEETLGDYDNIEVINEDFMKLDLADVVESRFPDDRFALCANLPYYITTPILMRVLENSPKPASIVVMVQREVADRLVSKPGSAEYGAVTASVAWYGKAEKLFAVPSGCFTPRPKVDSAVIRIIPHSEPPAAVSDEDMRRVIRGAFAQRRKTLVNSLLSEYPMSRDDITSAVLAAGLPADIRGERLGVQDFAALATELAKI
ncbi:MAG: 16S rRNA (adenine(1518)-N(6)/adenine(1519)-N(6))-dimethyltransferase RsmA [Clostridiales bacterium]|nr:16S rRNA (adenine(1518)-N(6)/adenine(1519)-N(6))-dimethyltransferase RsmA [Clostridiales bacterium]